MIYLVPGRSGEHRARAARHARDEGAADRPHGPRPADPGPAGQLHLRRRHRQSRRRRLVEPQRRDDRPRGLAPHAGADRARPRLVGGARHRARAASRRPIAAAGSTGRSACCRSARSPCRPSWSRSTLLLVFAVVPALAAGDRRRRGGRPRRPAAPSDPAGLRDRARLGRLHRAPGARLDARGDGRATSSARRAPSACRSAGSSTATRCRWRSCRPSRCSASASATCSRARCSPRSSSPGPASAS